MFNFLFRKKRQYPIVVVNEFDDEYINDFVYKWNGQYPIDRWFRKKHKIAFNSPEHRVLSLFDMRFEFEEDHIFDRQDNENYIPNKGEWLKKQKSIIEDENLTEEEKLEKFKDEFSNTDLSQYDE